MNERGRIKRKIQQCEDNVEKVMQELSVLAEPFNGEDHLEILTGIMTVVQTLGMAKEGIAHIQRAI